MESRGFQSKFCNSHATIANRYKIPTPRKNNIIKTKNFGRLETHGRKGGSQASLEDLN